MSATENPATAEVADVATAETQPAGTVPAETGGEKPKPQEVTPASQQDEKPQEQPADVPDEKELEAFRKWKDSQKTAEQKQKEELDALNERKKAAEERASKIESKYAAVMKGVKAKAIDDVILLATPKVSKTVTLEQAIDGVLEKYPQFKSSTPTITTGVRTTGGSDSADDSQARRVMGLKPKTN